MGNNNSTLKKFKKPFSFKKHGSNSNTQIKEISKENAEQQYYLSNHNDDDLSRQRQNHFFRMHVFNNNFSAPINEILLSGCNVLT